MPSIFLLSDLHLSPTHGFFWENWTRVRDAANASAADLVIIAGDLCINGPDSDAEMAFAARALTRLTGPWKALPGNHDVGDEPPGQDKTQLIDAARIARWHASFGPDRFAETVGAWRIIGLNAQLLGSGLPQEAAQDAWLDAELAQADGPIILVLHKPLFLMSSDETAIGATCVNPVPRAALLARLHGHDVRLVISGHLHAHRDVVIDGIRYLWLPATSFTHHAHESAVPMVGVTRIDLSDDAAHVEITIPAGVAGIDLAELKQHGRYAFLRDMPACPPDEDA